LQNESSAEIRIVLFDPASKSNSKGWAGKLIAFDQKLKSV